MKLSLLEKKYLSKREAQLLAALTANTLFYGEKKFSAIKDYILKNYFTDDPKSAYYILKFNKFPVGVIVVRTLHIHSVIRSLVIHPEFQNKGFGSRLLRYALSKVSHNQPVFIKTANPKSANLLKRFNFKFLSDETNIDHKIIEDYKLNERIEIKEGCVPFRYVSSYPWVPYLQRSNSHMEKEFHSFKRHPADRIVFVRTGSKGDL